MNQRNASRTVVRRDPGDVGCRHGEGHGVLCRSRIDRLDEFFILNAMKQHGRLAGDRHPRISIDRQAAARWSSVRPRATCRPAFPSRPLHFDAGQGSAANPRLLRPRESGALANAIQSKTTSNLRRPHELRQISITMAACLLDEFDLIGRSLRLMAGGEGDHSGFCTRSGALRTGRRPGQSLIARDMWRKTRAVIR